MALRIANEDAFEDEYTNKFLSRAAKYGVSIEYKRDRAALDRGLHLTAMNAMTNIRIWFQFKGLHAKTISADEFNQSAGISVELKLEHLRFWYQSPEPVYLVLYIESADTFLVEDVRTLIDRRWGDELLNPALFGQQVTVTIQVPTNAQLTEARWNTMFAHQSMRTDGVSFHGRPLGHSHSPLSSILLRMDPSLFSALVRDLLLEHGYRIAGELDARPLFPESTPAANIATLTYGELLHQYELKLQITNEFIPDDPGELQREGRSGYVVGPCAILIHSNVESCPDRTGVIALAHKLKSQGIKQLIAFVNGYMIAEGSTGYCGHVYLSVERESGVACWAQHLEDIAFSLCITTNTYHRFRDKVAWWGGPIWMKDKSVTILSD